MNLGLENRNVLVSGSSRGIGRAIAEAFLHEGARVVITGRDEASLQAAADALCALKGAERVLTIAGDLGQPVHVARTLEHTLKVFGSLDIVVANVGTGVAKSGWDLEPSDWTASFDDNLFGGMTLLRAAITPLKESKCGSIVLVASIAGLEAIDAPIVYAAAKAGVVAAGKSLSRLLGRDGIRVNVVAPGNVLCPGGSWDRKLAERREHFERYVHNEVPLQRFGSPQEIADAVVFLASERASFITGACLVVDGGQTRAFG